MRLPEATKRDLLMAFVQGVTAYQQRFDEGACVDSRERFYRLVRACCALQAAVDGSTLHIASCESPASGVVRTRLRGWATATRVIVIAVTHDDGRMSIGPPPSGLDEVITTLRERTAIGGVYFLHENAALANLQVHGNYVVVRQGRHASLAMTPIEIFWEYARDRLKAFRKVPCKFFHLYMGEICYRFNHRALNLYDALYDLLQTVSIEQAKAVVAGKLPEAAGHEPVPPVHHELTEMSLIG